MTDKTKTRNKPQQLWAIATMPPLIIHSGLILLVLVSICILRMTDNVSQTFTEQIFTLITSTVLGGGAVSVGTRLGGKLSDKQAKDDSAE